uniref:Uncharacterized protein n=1 Tax=viral metagenome TaxID=1070528 RepID=A0A6C0D8Y0_9ZZZZ
MSLKVEIPKKKPNHFIVYKQDNTFEEVKYLTQNELAEGWEQVVPHYGEKKLINHFSLTLAYLPEKFWSKLRKDSKSSDDSYKIIKDGITRYTIIETNQDDTMKKLYIEIRKIIPDVVVLQECVDELDQSQHSSWLVIRAKHYLKYGVRLDIA